jgi:hypothetical protein
MGGSPDARSLPTQKKLKENKSRRIPVHWAYIALERLLKDIIEGKISGMRRRGRRRKQLLDDLKEVRRYWNLKEEAQDRTPWRTQFGRCYGPDARQATI